MFLIADHMPFPGAAEDLAKKFGFELNNGYAYDTTGTDTVLFIRGDGTLTDNIITKGRNEQEKVDSIYSFTGQAFQIPDDTTPVLLCNNNFVSVMPDTAWNFKDDTPQIPVAGCSQGSYKNFGKGRVVVWGEAAMFSAQIAGEKKAKVGMNSPKAKSNYQLLLNIIHWLDGLLE